MQILLVDDGELIRNVVTAQLKILGHDVDAVEDGEQAVSLAHSKHYDLILMDVSMPVMDGWEATRLIRAREQQLGLRHLPIVALTALFDRDSCTQAGMDGYVQKPVMLHDLAKLIEAWTPKASDHNSLGTEKLSPETGTA